MKISSKVQISRYNKSNSSISRRNSVCVADLMHLSKYAPQGGGIPGLAPLKAGVAPPYAPQGRGNRIDTKSQVALARISLV